MKRSYLKSALGLCLVSTLIMAGCGAKAPPEANEALDAAIKALGAGDEQGFGQKVLPDQREGIKATTEWVTFFKLVKGGKIDNEFDSNVTDDSATIRTRLHFNDDESAYSNIAFVMKKADGSWYIDLKETVKLENDVNPGHAFKIWTMEVSP
jgi:hypothetical protein